MAKLWLCITGKDKVFFFNLKIKTGTFRVKIFMLNKIKHGFVYYFSLDM